MQQRSWTLLAVCDGAALVVALSLSCAPQIQEHGHHALGGGSILGCNPQPCTDGYRCLCAWGAGWSEPVASRSWVLQGLILLIRARPTRRGCSMMLLPSSQPEKGTTTGWCPQGTQGLAASGHAVSLSTHDCVPAKQATSNPGAGD